MADLSDRERRRLKRSVLVSLAFWSLVLIMFLLARRAEEEGDVRFQTVSLNLAPRQRARSSAARAPTRCFPTTRKACAAKAEEREGSEGRVEGSFRVRR
jgi:hypothetical protein